MAEGTLFLGPIAFGGLEVVGGVSWGGAENLAVHQLPDGSRVIDDMGRNDAAIAWEGVFSGEEAASRARTVDLMRTSGASWPLIWNWFFYTVVVARFEAEYAAPGWIPYRITCTVVRDEAKVVVEAALSLAQSVANDLAAAAAYNSGVSFTSASAACTAAGATQPQSAAHNAAVVAMAGLGASIDTAAATADSSFAAVTIAGPEDVLAATSLAGQMATLNAARGFTRRAAANLANAAA